MSQFEASKSRDRATAPSAVDGPNSRSDIQKSVEESLQAKMPERKADGVGEVSARSVAQVMQELIGAGEGFRGAVETQSRARVAPITVTEKLRQGLPVDVETPTQKESRELRESPDKKARATSKDLPEKEPKTGPNHDPRATKEQPELRIPKAIQLSRDGAAQGERGEKSTRDQTELRGSAVLSKTSLREVALQLVNSFPALERLSNEVQYRQIVEVQQESSKSSVQDLRKQEAVYQLDRFSLKRSAEGEVKAETIRFPEAERLRSEQRREFVETSRTENSLLGNHAKADTVRVAEVSQTALRNQETLEQQRRQHEENRIREIAERSAQARVARDTQEKRERAEQSSSRAASKFGGRGGSGRSSSEKKDSLRTRGSDRGNGSKGRATHGARLLFVTLVLGVVGYLFYSEFAVMPAVDEVQQDAETHPYE